MTPKERKRALTVFASVLLITMVLANPLKVYMKEANAQQALPKIQIVPSNITIGEIGKPVPKEQIFTANVTVSNVTDLYAWQIKLYFDEEILKFENGTGATISTAISPEGDFVANDTNNIFWNQKVLMPSAVVMKDFGTNRFYIQFGAYLLGDVPGVNGSGVLCKLNFKGVSTGTSHLIFAQPSQGEDTYLLSSKMTGGSSSMNIVIPADLADASVEVLGTGISIVVNPSEFSLGTRANITGLLFPPEITDVTIYYQLNGTDNWNTLTTETKQVSLNATYWQARYNCTWKPDKAGLYRFYAEGGTRPEDQGGGHYTSRVKEVLVNPNPAVESLGMEFYVSIAAVAAASVVMFFTWDRRRRRSGRLILP